MTPSDFNLAKVQIMWVPRPGRLRRLQKLGSPLENRKEKSCSFQYTVFFIVIFVLPMKYVYPSIHLMNEFVYSAR